LLIALLYFAEYRTIESSQAETVERVRNIATSVAELVATEDLSNINPTNPLANNRLFCGIDLV
jgi:hypothetical protein